MSSPSFQKFSNVKIVDHFTLNTLDTSKVSYIFEGEEVDPKMEKQNCLYIELNKTGERVENILSYSDKFLLSNATIELIKQDEGEGEGEGEAAMEKERKVELVVEGMFCPSKSDKKLNLDTLERKEEDEVMDRCAKLESLFIYRNQVLKQVLDFEADNFKTNNNTDISLNQVEEEVEQFDLN